MGTEADRTENTVRTGLEFPQNLVAVGTLTAAPQHPGPIYFQVRAFGPAPCSGPEKFSGAGLRPYFGPAYRWQCTGYVDPGGGIYRVSTGIYRIPGGYRVPGPDTAHMQRQPRPGGKAQVGPALGTTGGPHGHVVAPWPPMCPVFLTRSTLRTTCGLLGIGTHPKGVPACRHTRCCTWGTPWAGGTACTTTPGPGARWPGHAPGPW